MLCNALNRGFKSSLVMAVIFLLRSVTLRFLLRELSISLLYFDAIKCRIGQFFCVGILVWPGAARSPSAVSRFCDILGNG